MTENEKLEKLAIEYENRWTFMYEEAEFLEHGSEINAQSPSSMIMRAFSDGYKAAQRWIPVTERLPDKGGCYLTFASGWDIRYFTNGAWFNPPGQLAHGLPISHWMELPLAPEGK